MKAYIRKKINPVTELTKLIGKGKIKLPLFFILQLYGEAGRFTRRNGLTVELSDEKGEVLKEYEFLGEDFNHPTSDKFYSEIFNDWSFTDDNGVSLQWHTVSDMMVLSMADEEVAGVSRITVGPQIEPYIIDWMNDESTDNDDVAKFMKLYETEDFKTALNIFKQNT